MEDFESDVDKFSLSDETIDGEEKIEGVEEEIEEEKENEDDIPDPAYDDKEDYE